MVGDWGEAQDLSTPLLSLVSNFAEIELDENSLVVLIVYIVQQGFGTLLFPATYPGEPILPDPPLIRSHLALRRIFMCFPHLSPAGIARSAEAPFLDEFTILADYLTRYGSDKLATNSLTLFQGVFFSLCEVRKLFRVRAWLLKRFSAAAGRQLSGRSFSGFFFPFFLKHNLSIL